MLLRDCLYLYGYNKYAEVTGYSIGAGACANNRREGTLLQIEDDTKLMHFLSVDAEDQWEGSDLLRVVLQDIVSSFNSVNTFCSDCENVF